MSDSSEQVMKRAKLVAMMGRLIDTYRTPQERLEAIEDLLACGILRRETAAVLFETYVVERA